MPPAERLDFIEVPRFGGAQLLLTSNGGAQYLRSSRFQSGLPAAPETGPGCRGSEA
jgi:hypothetical protein